jgi:hypothetical protein
VARIVNVWYRRFGGSRGRGRALAIGAAAALAAGVVVSALPQLRGVGRVADHLRYEARLDRDLGRAVARVGGRGAVARCGAGVAGGAGGAVTGPLSVTALAWRLREPIERVGLVAPAPGAAGVVFGAAPTLDDPVAPPSVGALPVVARVGGWSVYSNCGGLRRS